MKPFRAGRLGGAAVLAAMCVVAGGAASVAFGICGPFTDVSDAAFCPFVLEIFTLGITTGTSPTTYDPTSSVNRLQMAAFLSRTVDGALKRGSRRAALDQFWTPQNAAVLSLTTLGGLPLQPRSDGADIWVPYASSVARVRASDGKLIENWTAAGSASAVVVAMGRVLVGGSTVPGRLYSIDPSQPAGTVTTVASTLGDSVAGIAFDGARVWSANVSGSVSIVTPAATIPWTVTTVTAGFSGPVGVLYDGANIWVADQVSNSVRKLDAAGAVLLTVTVGANPQYPVFDGTNLWVPNASGPSVSVVRVSSGAVLATLTGNGLSGPQTAAFDGQRVLVTNFGNDSVSLWKAADLTAIGTFSTGTGTQPLGACSNGINFWIGLYSPGQIARF